MRPLSTSLILLLVLAMAACSSGNKPAQGSSAETKSGNTEKKTEPSQYETGRTAFQKLFVAARGFAPDARPYRIESAWTDGAPTEEGKAGIWRAQFASPSRRAIKAYMWSGVSGPDMPDRGVSHGTEDTYNPSNSSTQVFDVNFLKVDTDKAFEQAQKHGGEKLTKKDPKQPVTYTLDFDSRKNLLLWHVVYGTNRNDAKLRVAINATTGGFIGVER